MYGLDNTLKRRLVAAALVALCAVAAAAQSRDEHLISAKPGGINFVSGDVKFRPEGAKEWRRLTDSDTLETGDTVATGAFAHVEVLLNPGSYLRLGANSELKLADAFLDNLRLELVRGSGIVEAVGFDGLDIRLLVDTPHTRVAILRSGLYRVNVTGAGATEVAVFKGRAEVGREQIVKLKGGRLARVSGATTEVVKLDKKNTDALDDWSRERAGTLAKINQKLSRREMNAIFARTDWNSLWPTSPNGSFWFFSRATRCWVLLPGGFTSWAWTSPYGHSYNYLLSIGVAPCPTCPYYPTNPYGINNGYGGRVTNPPPGGYGNGNGNGNGSGYGGGSGNGGNVTPPPPPPRDTAPREFVRPSMDAPRPMPAEQRNSPAMPTRDQ